MATTSTERVFNFSAGPAMLPRPVLERARDEMLALPGVGANAGELSHRSSEFGEIIADAESNLRTLLAIPANYKVLFLQGGARLQFLMIPKNLCPPGAGSGDYIVTGSWGKYAAADAALDGHGRVIYDGKATNFDRTPAADEFDVAPDAAYVHVTNNETIQGVQFPAEPEVGPTPLVADCSSEFLSKPMDVSKYGLIYACAQKNAGIAGVTMVIVRDDLLERSPEDLPGMLSYRKLADAGSMFNTPPTFAIYILKLITEWLLRDIGGLDMMATINVEKATLLYDLIDSSDGFYTGHAAPAHRSTMNVPFKLKDAELDKAFLAGAAENGMITLGGHRSIGGMRASIYNAMPLEGVRALANYMRDFAAKHG